MQALSSDLRFAFRTLRKGWLVTLVALFSLAIAIGGNTAVFGLVNALIFRPMPFEEPHRLVLVEDEFQDQPDMAGISTSLASYADLEERSRTTSEWAALRPRTVVLRGSDRSEAVSGREVTPSFFPLLRVQPTLGRFFLPEEGVEGGPGVVILSHEFRVNTFGADADPVGETLMLDGSPHEVVGVLPAGFNFLLGTSDLWLPLTQSPYSEARTERTVTAIARMIPTVSMEQVREEMAGLSRQLSDEHPEELEGLLMEVRNVRNDIPSTQGRILFGLLQGFAMAVLLIACVNLINLLMARGQARQQEMAVRVAMGASRWRILKQLLTESLVLSSLGALLGLALGAGGIRFMANRFAGTIPSSFTPTLDWRVVTFTLGISVVAGLIFGAFPALSTFRSGQMGFLKERSGTSGSGIGRRRMTRILIVAEVALALVALGGGGILVDTFLGLQRLDAGIDRSNLLTTQITVPTSRYSGDEEARLALEEIVAEVGRLPAVQAAALTSSLPMGAAPPADSFRVSAAGADPDAPPNNAYFLRVSPEYSETLDVPILEGRFFDATDSPQGSNVVVISRALATEHFPGASAVGQSLEISGESHAIIGVLADVQHNLFLRATVREPGSIYFPAAHTPRAGYSLMVRAGGDPSASVPALRGVVQTLDPDLALTEILTLDQIIRQAFVAVDVLNLILIGFGIAAIVLAAVGVFGVITFAVSRRHREIGVRMAMGGEGREIVGMFAREGLWLGAIGSALGLLLTFPVFRILRSIYQDIVEVEWSTVLVSGSILFAVTVIASFLSASKAARVQPIESLNTD